MNFKDLLFGKTIYSTSARSRAIKGFTLIELSIAMSIGALIIAGLSVILVSTSRSINVTQTVSNQLLDAKMLSLAIDNVVDQNNGEFSYVVNDYNNATSYKEIEKNDLEQEKILFSLYDKNGELLNFVFCYQNFGYYSANDEDFVFKNLYTTRSKIKLDVKSQLDSNNNYSGLFTFNYGDNQSQTLRLFKTIGMI